MFIQFFAEKNYSQSVQIDADARFRTVFNVFPQPLHFGAAVNVVDNQRRFVIYKRLDFLQNLCRFVGIAKKVDKNEVKCQIFRL